MTDSTGRSSATVVFVSVADVNDNSPTFTTTVLQTSVPENTPVTTSILQVANHTRVVVVVVVIIVVYC